MEINNNREYDLTIIITISDLFIQTTFPDIDSLSIVTILGNKEALLSNYNNCIISIV